MSDVPFSEPEKVVTGGADTEFYFNHDWQLLQSVNMGTSALDAYVWSPRYVDAPIVRLHDGDGDCVCDPVNYASDTIRYYTGDANYNVTTTITIGYTGTVVQHYSYSAYGKATVYDDAWTNPAAPTEDGPLYCGYMFDAETGSNLARNRYYHVALATWISRDPIGYRGGINLYEYVADNPTNATDPQGKEPVTVAIVTVTISNIAYHGILTLFAGYYFSQCYNAAQELINKAARNFCDAEKFAAWLKAAKPGAECAELATMALKQGAYTFIAVVGGVVVKYGIQVNTVSYR